MHIRLGYIQSEQLYITFQNCTSVSNILNCIPINNISVINQLYIYFKLFLITVYHSGWTISFRLIDSYPIANISILGLIFFLNVK